MDEAGGRWVMVNCTGDTLTDSASGGIGNWVLGVVRAAERNGSIVPVITKAHPGRRSSWPHAVEIPYPWPSFRGNLRVDSLLRRHTHYVHPWQPRWNRLVLATLAEVAPDPCNLLFHNDPELAVVVAEALPRHRVWHLLHNTNTTHRAWQARFLSTVRPLAISDYIARWWEQELGASPATVQTLYSGVDSGFFTPAPKSSPALITYVGLLNERKAPDLLLAACRRIVDEGGHPPFAVSLIGATHYDRDEDDPYVHQLEEAARRLSDCGVEVALSGFLSRAALAQTLAGASINVVPSRVDEAFSLAALEGMAAGAATVVARRGGLPEAVGDAALVVPGDDVAALTEALRTLLLDTDTRTGLGRKGRQRAVAMSWDRTWGRLKLLDDGAASQR
jgi:glycosyltransferase involved in cell wall biosynthesis